MTDITATPTPQSAPAWLAPEAVRAAMRRLYVSQGFGLIFVMLLYRGGLLSLYALHLGATNVHLGIFTALYEGSYLYGYFVSPWIARYGKLRWMISGLWVMTVASLGFFLVQPIYAAGGSAAGLAALLVVMFFVNTLLSISTTSWWPLLRDIIPAEIIGVFFGRLRTVIEVAGLASVLALSVFLGQQPATWKFLVAFGVGIAGQVARILLIRDLPDPVGAERPVRSPRPHRSAFAAQLAALKRPLVDRPFVYFCILTFVLYTLMTLPTPLYVPFLKTSRAFPISLTVLTMAGTALGSIVSLIAWGRYADRHSARRVFALSCVPLALLFILLALTPAYSASPAVAVGMAVVCFAGIGIGSAGFGMAYTTYVFQAAPPDDSSIYMGLWALMYGVGAIVGPLAGGSLADALAGRTLRVAGVVVDNYQMVIIAAGALLLPALLMVRGLKTGGNN